MRRELTQDAYRPCRNALPRRASSVSALITYENMGIFDVIALAGTVVVYAAMRDPLKACRWHILLKQMKASPQGPPFSCTSVSLAN